MSNTQDWYEEDDFDFEDYEEETPRPRGEGDKNALNKVRKAERAQAKRVKELEAELESLRNFQRETLVNKVLSEKGINPVIADLIPKEVASDNEALSGWIEKYGSVLGVPASNPSTQVDEQELSALRQIDAVTSGAISPDNVNDAFSTINNAASAEELLNFLYSQGAE